MNKRAQDIIKIYDLEYAKDAPMRTLWQEVADLMFTRKNSITTVQSPGKKKADVVYDTTGSMASDDFASGLSSVLIPPGQRFFELVVKNGSDNANRYFSYLTDATHDEIFKSNFMIQFNETLRSMGTFGPCCLYSEFGLIQKNGVADGVDTALNFCDYDIGTYVFQENNKGLVNTVLVEFQYTARQIVDEWGEENCPKKILDAIKKPETENDSFKIIHCVRPRRDRNPNLSDKMNMAFESVYVLRDEAEILDEGGFEEFPFHVGRWAKSSGEKCGRGIGTEILPTVKMLQSMSRDLIEWADKLPDPPREVLSTFEGVVKTGKGMLNFVSEINSIKALDMGSQNFPIDVSVLEFKQKEVKDAFLITVFNQLLDLTGDRRTTVEIQARLREGLKRLTRPSARVYGELLNTIIPRCVNILIRNGIVAPPPPEIAGTNFEISYIGPLALALKGQQAQGYVEWVGIVAQTEQLVPGSLDIVNIDAGNKELARAYGVKITNVASDDEITQKRQARAQAQQAAMEQQQMDTMGKTYKNSTTAPESGSPAELLLGVQK